MSDSICSGSEVPAQLKEPTIDLACCARPVESDATEPDEFFLAGMESNIKSTPSDASLVSCSLEAFKRACSMYDSPLLASLIVLYFFFQKSACSWDEVNFSSHSCMYIDFKVNSN